MFKLDFVILAKHFKRCYLLNHVRKWVDLLYLAFNADERFFSVVRDPVAESMASFRAFFTSYKLVDFKSLFPLAHTGILT